MSNIRTAYEELRLRYPSADTYTLFAKVINGSGYSIQSIRNWFKVLVDPKDYGNENPRTLIKALITISKEAV